MRLPSQAAGAVGRAFINLKPEVAAAILQTMRAGWEIASARPEVHANAGEVPMTECLRDGMRAALRALPWRATMVVLPGTESRSTPEVLVPDGRTDIPIIVVPVFTEMEEHDPHAIIECKRIAPSEPTLVREYIVSGVDRFARGKYGATHSQGFMAAYIIAGTIVATVIAVNDYLESRGRSAETLRDCNSLVSEWARTSRHPRKDSSVDLHHAFLVTA